MMLKTRTLPVPSPQDVSRARKLAGLNQTEAAQLVSDGGVKSYRTWQRYEAEVGRADHRPIPSALWELFLLLTDQHPGYVLTRRRQPLPDAQ